MPVRARPHVQHERIEGINPPVAYRDPATTVVSKPLVLWIEAAGLHVLPALMFWKTDAPLAMTMLCEASDSLLGPQAAARL
jgi:hypothetical protein